eukprot:CAMPEP_0171154242 /NCGR_PEP_ID=MMETSP0790-20130122/193_1 /TAXON_ID=2925 /ORGANISM="Alexandrium catenella, Strain OF101" /LENGTH=70 /DNA_ID=CAMNT_0011618243 /DNA_START=59 /DNA_END=267 /DNA_ORIENTATION=-
MQQWSLAGTAKFNRSRALKQTHLLSAECWTQTYPRAQAGSIRQYTNLSAACQEGELFDASGPSHMEHVSL